MRLEKILWLFSVIFMLTSAGIIGCTSKPSQKEIVIKGNLKNLPDGKMYLLGKGQKLIDSTATKNGAFGFVLSVAKYKEPIFLELQHLDRDNNKRFLHFETNQVYNGGSRLSQYFMLEDGIFVNGNLVDFDPVNIKLPDSIKLVYPDTPIRSGRQTDVMYNTMSYDFSRNVNDSILRETNSLIRKYPYSYYLLYELKDWMGNFSNSQLNDLIACFDKDVQQSPTMQDIKKRMHIRSAEKLGGKTVMSDKNGQQRKIIDEAVKVNMVVL